jgi:hypothetical protein
MQFPPSLQIRINEGEGKGGGLFEQKISRPEGQLDLEEVVSVSRVNEIFMRSFNARYSPEQCFGKQINKIIKKKKLFKNNYLEQFLYSSYL